MPTKSRYYPCFVTYPDGYRQNFQDTTCEELDGVNSAKTNGFYRSFNPVTHYKMLTPGDYVFNSGRWQCSMLHHIKSASGLIYSNAISKAFVKLDFQDNNNFELIPFLMDWDSTIAMFSKKFLKEISYGAVTWGVLPFVSDVKSLVGTLKDINSGIADSYNKIIGKRISRRVPFRDSFDDGYFKLDVTGHINYNGFISGELAYPNNALDSILLFLDELGVNPDLKTLWDIIPLSFAVDYILPIGDMLETAHPRGWFNPQFVVTGAHSVKAEITLTGLGKTHTGPGGTYKMYIRHPGALVLGSRPSVDPKFETPDLKEIFNLAYLKLSTSKR